VHAEEHPDQGVALHLVENPKEIRPTGERQGSCIIDGVEK